MKMPSTKDTIGCAVDIECKQPLVPRIFVKKTAEELIKTYGHNLTQEELDLIYINARRHK
jgi:hypothetical protein